MNQIISQTIIVLAEFTNILITLSLILPKQFQAMKKCLEEVYKSTAGDGDNEMSCLYFVYLENN